jgi:hypothetical protein
MEVVKLLNLGVSFLLELIMIGALGYWGFNVDRSMAVKIIAGIGAPTVAILLWALFAAPKSEFRFAESLLTIFIFTMFSLGAFALYKSGHPAAALLFIAVVILNTILNLRWQQ